MSKSTLLLAFEKIVNEFNACSEKRDYTTLKPLLDPNIIISKVDDISPPPTSIATADEVINYLQKNQKDKGPRFDQSTTEETGDLSKATVAQVSGIARYKDTKDTLDANRLRVRYFFTFSRPDAASSAWLLVNASIAKAAP